MREISAKEIKFVECFLETGGDMSRAAVLAGYSEKNASSAGNRIYKRERVQAKLAELREQMEKSAEYNRNKMFEELERIKKEARAGDYPNYAAMLKAIEMQCKMLGYFEPEVQQVSNYDVSIKVLNATPAPPVPPVAEGGI
ncbi:MAG: terminase small subunit [Fibromonadales bacterium]|nr:terminase small subunit [Fibromonadales bacterium]